MNEKNNIVHDDEEFIREMMQGARIKAPENLKYRIMHQIETENWHFRTDVCRSGCSNRWGLPAQGKRVCPIFRISLDGYSRCFCFQFLLADDTGGRTTE